MRNHYDFAVIGAGSIGSSAAWTLAKNGCDTVLIGPGEPLDKKSHSGVFGSHYDQGRITRILDKNPILAKLARYSIDRYEDLEQASGTKFYYETGMVHIDSEKSSYIDTIDKIASQLDAGQKILSPEKINELYPALNPPQNSTTILQAKRAGYINPRDHVHAAITAFEKCGGHHVQSTVAKLDVAANSVTINCADGPEITASKILVATGAFSGAKGLLPAKPKLKVQGRTVVMFEVDPNKDSQVMNLPSIIQYMEIDGVERDMYSVSPVAYPDGKIYLKAGTGHFDNFLSDENGLDEISNWFKGHGEIGDVEYICDVVKRLVPEIDIDKIQTSRCVTTFTVSGYPYIDFIPDTPIGIAVGGNGMAAKSAIAFGDIAAEIIAGLNTGIDVDHDLFKATYVD